MSVADLEQLATLVGDGELVVLPSTVLDGLPEHRFGPTYALIDQLRRVLKARRPAGEYQQLDCQRLGPDHVVVWEPFARRRLVGGAEPTTSLIFALNEAGKLPTDDGPVRVAIDARSVAPGVRVLDVERTR